MTDTSEPVRLTEGNTPVIAVVGPTASGKSALADTVAALLDTHIVSADSMQVYTRMDIGTAKTPVDQRSVPYHCIDLVEPGEPFSAALYQQHARDAIHSIHSRGSTPVVAGGTGLYIRAALDSMEFPQGHLDTDRRRDIERLAEEIGPHALHARLARIDPESAQLIHPNNVRRTIRALEMAQDGTSYASMAARFASRNSVYAARFIGLETERHVLYEHIDARVDSMMQAGLLGEVESLLDAGFRDALTAQQAIGYKELVPVIENDASLEEAVAAIKQATRRYAKRQMTWFRSDSRIEWVDVTGRQHADVVEEVMELIGSSEGLV